MNEELAIRAGLIKDEKNEYGEQEWIGREEDWQQYRMLERVQEHANCN